MHEEQPVLRRRDEEGQSFKVCKTLDMKIKQKASVHGHCDAGFGDAQSVRQISTLV